MARPRKDRSPNALRPRAKDLFKQVPVTCPKQVHRQKRRSNHGRVRNQGLWASPPILIRSPKKPGFTDGKSWFFPSAPAFGRSTRPGLRLPIVPLISALFVHGPTRQGDELRTDDQQGGNTMPNLTTSQNQKPLTLGSESRPDGAASSNYLQSVARR